MLKPDALRRGLVGDIFSRFEKRGFIIKQLRQLSPSSSTFADHYSDFRDKSFFKGMIDFLCTGPVIIAIMEGNIDTARKLVGDTVPSNAAPDSIRGMYASSLPENLIHCSHDAGVAALEVAMWAPLFS